MRERAAQAREIAAQISDRAAAKGLLRYAEEYEAKALALERETTVPAAAAIPSGEPPIARAGAALKPEAPHCETCDSTGWVCEDHRDRPWSGRRPCGCGGAGAQCPACNDVEPPRVTGIFEQIDADSDEPPRPDRPSRKLN